MPATQLAEVGCPLVVNTKKGERGLGDTACVVGAVVSVFKQWHVACCRLLVEDGLSLDSEGAAKPWPRGG